MNKKPLVSIVIPCYNAIDLIEGCLKTVFRTTYENYEVLIVDDMSKDGTYELLQKKYARNKKLRILQNKVNSGPSVTRNHGIGESKGKYIAFIETDMEVEPDWLEPLVKALESNSKLGAVQSRVLDINRRDKYHSIGVKYNPHTFWVISPQCGLDKNYWPEDRSMGIGSVGSMMRKDVLDKVGFYDEKLTHNIDDIELGWRIWLAGYDVEPIFDSVTYHWTAKPLQKRAKATSCFSSEFHFHKGARIILKNYELKNVIKYLPWQFLAYLVRIVKHLVNGNTIPLRAFGKALVWNVTNFGNALSERKRIQKLRKRTDDEMFRKLAVKSGFFEFYLKIVPANLRWVEEVFANTKYKKEDQSKKANCLICGYTFYIDESPVAMVSGRYKYKICPVCQGGTLVPKPDSKDLEKVYKSEKYYKNLSNDVKSPLVQWVITRKIYEEPYEWVQKNFKKGKILDVGCGNGEFLEHLHNDGWQVEGVDISNVAKKTTEEKIGKGKVKLGEFPRLRFKEKYDYVSFWHVLEHVDDPGKYLLEAAKVLKKGGKIVAEVPNLDSQIFKLFQNNYNWIMVPVHVSYFSKKSIRQALEQAGYKNIRIETPPRALLNFALSFDKYLFNKTNKTLRRLLFALSIPISISLGIVFASVGNGEVIRVYAQKR